jgi:hypothetical protein
MLPWEENSRYRSRKALKALFGFSAHEQQLGLD